MQLTVDRLELIKALEEKQVEVLEALDNGLKVSRAELEELNQEADGSQQYLKVMTALVAEGKIIAVYDRGWVQFTRADGFDGDLPKAPSNRPKQLIRRAEERIKSLEERRASKSAPYTAALRLLRMGQDVTVGIDTGDYHSLLGAADERNVTH